ncbi:hypothetical protein F5B21DRAFT_140565 [Xylaria acuta]|nr:hypothetical protein F5B21DRAFT_140565 [Xylaria acuta]
MAFQRVFLHTAGNHKIRLWIRRLLTLLTLIRSAHFVICLDLRPSVILLFTEVVYMHHGEAGYNGDFNPLHSLPREISYHGLHVSQASL